MTKSTAPSIAIACGGTGGHLFPGLAVAGQLLKRGCAVTLLVSPKEVDQQAVKAALERRAPAHGEDAERIDRVAGAPMEVVTLPAVGLQNRNYFSFGVSFLKAWLAARRAFRHHKPSAALAMGGFTSAPPIFAAKQLGAKLIVRTVDQAIANGTAVVTKGDISRNRLQIPALLGAIEEYRFDCCIGGARRDEEKARAKERFFSFRDGFGQWDPKNQRPEIWNLYNARLNPGENMRVFPLSNWTEMDVWQYIHLENIPIVPLYYAKEREVLVRGNSLIMPEQSFMGPRDGEKLQTVKCRMRSLGCSPCTGAIRSDADTIPKIIAELVAVRNSERENRVIDHDREGSMELKKREGYF